MTKHGEKQKPEKSETKTTPITIIIIIIIIRIIIILIIIIIIINHSRTGTAIRVAWTEDHLTRTDSENTSELPEQVNRPCDQPELKK